MKSITVKSYNESNDTFEVSIDTDNVVFHETTTGNIDAGVLAVLLDVSDEPSYFIGKSFDLL